MKVPQITTASRLLERMRTAMETVAASNHTFSANFRTGINCVPIPFFGNLTTARVVTIGVNPSADEFVGRGWPEQIDHQSLAEHLLRYFRPSSRPHPWFQSWTKALSLLNVDYASGGAAHLDLSPRATISIRAVPKPDLFLDMVSTDLRWFFEFLTECSQVRLLMAAGTVTKRWYINEFLAAHGPRNGFKMQPHPKPSDRCCFYECSYLDKTLPLFFSSVGPSDSKRAYLLIENVRAHQKQLLALLE